MRITNKHNLPESIVRAVERHDHKGADYSATQLLNPPRILHLTRRHEDELTQDVSERLWALRGSAIHSIAERGEGYEQYSEIYMEQEISGVQVSGTADLYDIPTETLYDFKDTSVWTIIFGSRLEDWERQVNIYAYLMRQEGYEVQDAQIIAFMRDWQKSKAKFDPNYPQDSVAVFTIPVWTEEEQYAYLVSRVATMESCKDTPDEALPFCSDSERWKKETKHAVMKEGRKSAVKVHDVKEYALKQAEELGPNHYVQTRPGEAKRCAEYCDVSRFCNQYQEELNEREDG